MKRGRLCDVCNDYAFRRNLCDFHYREFLDNGGDRIIRRPVSERIFENVYMDPNCGCWIWLGAVNSTNYGTFSIGRSNPILVHRVSHALFKGPIAKGFTIDHLCRNTLCVNPAHLEAVTQSINSKRGLSPIINKLRAQRMTHCKHGHPRTKENLWFRKNGYTICKECSRNLSLNSKAGNKNGFAHSVSAHTGVGE